jgi:hypothetical protein
MPNQADFAFLICKGSLILPFLPFCLKSALSSLIEPFGWQGS